MPQTTQRQVLTQDRPKVLVAASMWWPLAARMAMALLHHGYHVETLCPPGHPLRLVGGISKHHLYSRFDSIGALRAAMEHFCPERIVPCDDGVVWQLHSLHRQVPELRPLIEHSLGQPEGYPILQSRAALLDLALSLGIRVPETRAIVTEAELCNTPWTSSQVLKLDGTWGGNGVEIAHTPQQALTAFRRLSQPLGTALMLKRIFINHDPLALWMLRSHQAPLVTMQRLMPGRPANTMLACKDGNLLAMLTVEVLCTLGATGAATVVRVIHHREIEQAACRLAHRLQLNGFHGLDFILEPGTNAAYLIEINPRCTQLGHLHVDGQGDLAGAFLAPPQQPGPSVAGDIIAFFPQAVKANPANSYLIEACHDVPWQEPALVMDLFKDQWPNRQWPARLYHWLRPLNQLKEVTF